MEASQKISVAQCCSYYHIETSFVQLLQEHDLIELSGSVENSFIGFEQLADLEKYIRLYYELEINMEGIAAIAHLLDRVQELQQQLKRLQGS